ncbi:MAG: hypothetical protein PHC95_12815 [Parabacteroides sp.]|nr:hypothetical protein [Parabacteroides sp.]
MLFSTIYFKGSEKGTAIRTNEPIVLNSNDTEFNSFLDDSTGEIVQFRPADVLRINTIDESKMLEVPEKIPKKKEPKGMKIS